MKTITEIKKHSSTLLWVDEEKDKKEIENILIEFNNKGYDSQLFKDLNLSQNGNITIKFSDHPLLKIHSYFCEKYGDENGLAFFYRWVQEIGLFSKNKQGDVS